MNRHLRTQSGVTLIEVLVSAALISMVLIWISDAHIKSLNNISNSSQRTQSMWLGEEMIERMQVQPLLDLYQAEINGVTDASAYCQSTNRKNCVGSVCNEEDMITYNVQQIFCDNPHIDEFDMKLECFDITTGTLMSQCASRATIRGKVTVSWKSKNSRDGRLSTSIDSLFRGIEQALYFDGSNDYLQISGDIIPGDNFTIAIWVKPEEIDTSYHGFFGRQDGGTTSRPPSLWVGANGNLHYDSYDNSNVRYSDNLSGFFSAQQWVHVAWVKNGGTYRFYRNGSLFHQVTGIPATVKTRSNIRLGRIDNSFKGQLDELQTFDSALTADQIIDVMKSRNIAGVTPTCHLDFDGATWNDAKKDKSGNNHIISLNGGINENNRRHAVY